MKKVCATLPLRLFCPSLCLSRRGAQERGKAHLVVLMQRKFLVQRRCRSSSCRGGTPGRQDFKTVCGIPIRHIGEIPRPLAARKILHHGFLQRYTAAGRWMGKAGSISLIDSGAEVLLPKSLGFAEDRARFEARWPPVKIKTVVSGTEFLNHRSLSADHLITSEYRSVSHRKFVHQHSVHVLEASQLE